jgi:hypothetical protein
MKVSEDFVGFRHVTLVKYGRERAEVKVDFNQILTEMLG